MLHLAKKTVRTIVIFILLITVPYILAYFYINEKGKDMLTEFLKDNYSLDVKIESLNFGFPLKISLGNVVFKNISSSSVVIEFGGFNFSSREFIINRIWAKKIRINIDKSDFKKSTFQENSLSLQEKAFAEPDNTLVKKGNITEGKVELPIYGKEQSRFSIKLEELMIDDGMIVFSDKDTNPPLRLAVENIKGVLKDITLPEIDKIHLDLTSSIRVNKKLVKDSLILSGWVNWPKKDADIYLKAEKIDYFIFQDYLFGVWKPERLEIEEGVFSAGAHLVALNDDLAVDYFIVVDKVKFKDKPTSETQAKSLKTVLALFTTDGITRVHFTHKTKLSKPKFTLDDLGDNILTHVKASDSFTTMDSINRLVGRGQEAVEEGVGGIKGITIDPVVKALQSFGEELLGNIRKIFGIAPPKGVNQPEKDIFQQLQGEPNEEEMFEEEDKKLEIEVEKKRNAIEIIESITEEKEWTIEIQGKEEKEIDGGDFF